MSTLPLAPGEKKTWLVDIEVFPNFFYAAFYNGSRWKEYDHTTLKEMAAALNNKDLVLVGYNNFAYDDIILGFLCANPTVDCKTIYQTSQDLIKNKDKLREQIFQATYADRPWAYSIDVFQLLNGKGSLKEWACRIGAPVVAETPVDFDSDLPADRVAEVIRYCKNDVLVTKQLLVKNWDRVILRKTLADKFQLCGRVYCMSEQGVAQHTFLTLHRQRTGEKSSQVREASKTSEENQRIQFPMTELVSSNVSFETQPFKDFFTEYMKGEVFNYKDMWKIKADLKLDAVALASSEFAMGVGGIHSVDAPGIFESTEETTIIDLDVASYYPSLIIELGLHPTHMGPGFVEDMRRLRDMRLHAKRTGDKKTADALKIVINATFGKLNDKYSPIRSIPNAHRVTINGQLYILMLIEALTANGACSFISANTDGVTVRVSRSRIGEMREVCRLWQERTKMELEEVEYARIFRRDVNNYMAITTSGKVKYKGAINQESGKGDGVIVKEACERYLLDDIPPIVTIEQCEDPMKFLYYLKTKNGAMLSEGEQPIGKIARWYCSPNGKPLRRLNPPTEKRGEIETLVPNARKVVVVNDAVRLRKEDMDIDYECYETAAWNLIDTMGPTV